MSNIQIICIFLAALIGILLGAVFGFILLDYGENGSKRSKKRLDKKKSCSHKKVKTSKRNSILANRIERNESYTNFLCNSCGEDAKEKINNIRKRQDQKYNCDPLHPSHSSRGAYVAKDFSQH